ncbi:MAG: permease [Hoeflea sp.]|nr:permease [Hoeflea sp.]
MSDRAETIRTGSHKQMLLLGLLALVLAGTLAWPAQAWAMVRFVIVSLIEVAPLIIPGIVLAAWIVASGAGAPIARTFEGRGVQSIIAASLIGALTPVCGVTVLPLMTGLLAAGIPLAPVMAFWLSSPITDPAMLAATAATLGPSFAVGKTIAAFGLGIWGGAITVMLARSGGMTAPLRRNVIVGSLAQCGSDVELSFKASVWREAERRSLFRDNLVGTARLILICLVPAFAAEFALSAVLRPEALAAYVGADVWWAVPLAVFAGAPAYLDGYAALPLTRGLMEHGMSPGAAMAFLVSGGVISIWGAMAIFPVLRLKVFLLYLGLAVSGSLLAGYGFEWVM